MIGRADDMLNVAGHRIGTTEVETLCSRIRQLPNRGSSAFPTSCGRGDSAFVSCSSKASYHRTNCKRTLLDQVRRELGPVAVIGELNFVDMLPKTRSGKIMRRVLKAVTRRRTPATSPPSKTKARSKRPVTRGTR